MCQYTHSVYGDTLAFWSSATETKLPYFGLCCAVAICVARHISHTYICIQYQSHSWILQFSNCTVSKYYLLLLLEQTEALSKSKSKEDISCIWCLLFCESHGCIVGSECVCVCAWIFTFMYL